MLAALQVRWSVGVVIATATLLLPQCIAGAHPLSQGSLDVTVKTDAIVVIARVSAEEVAVTNSSVGDNPMPGPWAATGMSAFEDHAKYLAAHLHLTGDGAALAGRVVRVEPPRDGSMEKDAVYELDYPLSSPPRLVTLRQDALADSRLPSGQSWETLYVVAIRQTGRAASQSELSRADQVSLLCDWASPADASGSRGSAFALFKDFFIHGVHHIFGEPAGPLWLPRTNIGFDHLLFVTALVLGTRSLLDLVKVVTAFTLAHTITLGLAATRMLHVPQSVSEPLIAGSIVFVAVQNVFWPRQSRGWIRYAAAFFFGLFHGLGFAGGLLDAMRAMQGTSVFAAIFAFSIGVETAHQLVVVPLFLLLKAWRDTRASEPARDRLHFNVQRFGSAAISLVGLFYLVTALRMSYSAS